jgi:hypothetical protein
MGTQGSFGYKIGRKIRLMHVQFDADMLWQILVREIYVLMKHYGSIESLREVFINLLEAKNKPKPEAIEKCKVFTDLEVINKLKKDTSDWYCLTRHCQHSFINILESGYFLNNGGDSGLVFILDFNTNSVRFYGVDYEKKKTEYEKATIDEIMEFEDMPTKTYTEIVTEMNLRFENYDKQVKEVNLEIERINNIIKKAKELGGDENVITKANQLLDDMKWEKRKLDMKYRFFYHRLDALNLIDHESK